MRCDYTKTICMKAWLLYTNSCSCDFIHLHRRHLCAAIKDQNRVKNKGEGKPLLLSARLWWILVTVGWFVLVFALFWYFLSGRHVPHEEANLLPAGGLLPAKSWEKHLDTEAIVLARNLYSALDHELLDFRIPSELWLFSPSNSQSHV